MEQEIPSFLDESTALRAILEGTARTTGGHFFDALVINLAKVFHTHGAWVTEYLPETKRFKARALILGEEMLRDYELNIEGTPCEVVVRDLRLIHYPDRVQELFPNDAMLREVGTCSYMGVPLLDLDGRLLGHMAVVDRVPMPVEPRFRALFEIFAGRAAAELQRLRAEAEVQQAEQKLRRLVTSAMDAILELNQDLQIISMNPAAEKVFSCSTQEMIGQNFMKFLSPESCRKLSLLTHELQSRPEGQQYLWIPGNLEAFQFSGTGFTAEASLSRYELHGQTYYALILRNVNDRLEAEQKIQSLTVAAEYLREQIRDLQNFDEVIGESPEILQVLKDVHQVSAADTTVLITGETGTGKELIARAIHEGSPRKNKPLITVNCAAIPSTLIESEFFGHEAGAFTGATKKREGRFELADHGTIFLDEIGELLPDLQSKILRILQEGEYQPVGSSRTKKVNVRVIAATNRNLQEMIRQGKFREDLYYRIHVFPISLPPLRDRGDDVILLAKKFAEYFAQRMGKKLQPLTPENINRLKAYSWPGNVRELQNVIERAVITAIDGKLNFLRALPDVQPGTTPGDISNNAQPAIRTAKEFEQFEKENLLQALEATGWRIAGKDGAAQLLGLKPSTLTSRMKALGIERPKLRPL
ncbi:MAG TPA: sigma 54-interacting transcriptional regulator [Acidobacteriota bacterium]